MEESTDRFEAVVDEIYRKADALRTGNQTLTPDQALARVMEADPDLRRRYEDARREAARPFMASSPFVAEMVGTKGNEIRSFGPCTRCGLPIMWHNGLFLCGDCLADHFAMPNLSVWRVQGEIFSAKWAGYTFAALGSYTEAKSGEGNTPLFKPALAQAIWHFNDGFSYAEIRRLSSKGPAESIQLVNIEQTNRKEALRLATRGFGLLDFTGSTRGRPFLDAEIEAQQRAKMQQIMARYKKNPSFSMEAAAGFYGVPLSTLNRWRDKYGD